MDDVVFSPEQHRIWAWLYRNQLPNVQKHACRQYLQGFESLALPADRIPSLAELNEQITPRTGWRCKRTSVRYSDAVPWYYHFEQKIFLITDFLRSWEERVFTPEPDMFHDIFGHLPFLTLPAYAALEEMFAPAFLRATDEQRQNIKRLAWFSTEFGLIREEGELKVFGAGLLSSSAETGHVMSGKTPLKPFTIENVILRDKAIFDFNETLFVFDSVPALKKELARYFDPILKQPRRDDGYRWQDWNLAEYEAGLVKA